MHIKIKADAAAIYCRQFTEQMIPNWEWATILEQVQGQTLEVKTEHLSNDQFSAIVHAAVTPQELIGIGEELVEAVIDDVRPALIKCRACGKQSPKDSLACTHCGKTESLEPLDPAAPRTAQGLRRAGARDGRKGQLPQYPGIKAYMDAYNSAAADAEQTED
jgi:hypothetical protein